MALNANKPTKSIVATTKITDGLDLEIPTTGGKHSKWCKVILKNIDHIPKNPGVYCFVIPKTKIPKRRLLILHGRTFGSKSNRRQLQFAFYYRAAPFTDGSGLVMYVGKASNLHGRLKGHLSVNPKATTNQVLRGLVGKAKADIDIDALKEALEQLRNHGTIYYHEHYHKDELKAPDHFRGAGKSLVADRDLLEIMLIAKYAPPFNIKAER